VEIELIDRARFAELGGVAGVVGHLRGLAPAAPSVHDQVRTILEDVRQRREEALLDYSRRFDFPQASGDSLVVSMQELDEAMASLDPAVYAGLEAAIANVAQVAAAQISEERAVNLPQGQRVVVRETPVASAAVYVPGGRHPYASTVVMGTVTARAAGVLDVAIATPPGPDGRIDPCVLAACRMCGVTRIYRMGGAQAIAALAYGTEHVRPVEVIAGPGNLYVQEAKRQLAGVVGSDGFAGPSDLLVVFEGEGAARLLAFDLLAQAEHGEGTVVVGASPQRPALERLERELKALAAEGPQPQPSALALVELENPRQGIELANAFAPEHLQLVGEGLERFAGQVRAAGCVLLGPFSATAFGDYIAGSNHVLPTGGAARFASALSTATFMRRSYELRLDGSASRELAELAAPLAEREGFPWHARSMRARGSDRGAQR